MVAAGSIPPDATVPDSQLRDCTGGRATPWGGKAAGTVVVVSHLQPDPLTTHMQARLLDFIHVLPRGKADEGIWRVASVRDVDIRDQVQDPSGAGGRRKVVDRAPSGKIPDLEGILPAAPAPWPVHTSPGRAHADVLGARGGDPLPRLPWCPRLLPRPPAAETPKVPPVPECC